MTQRPTPTIRLANIVVSQLAWFAAVFAAARHIPLWGTACVLAAIGWHLVVSARPRREACLIGLAMLIGFATESVHTAMGRVIYPSGQFDARLAPYWIVALWGLFAIALNVTLRWLRHRLWLAALLGAVAGPLAFASGVRLGAAQFVDARPALLALALGWAFALPALVWLSSRFDGVAVPEPRHG
ncbi:DUF2878 domain-containing protein [Variovorax saccharolyticus]|uniref:DUF2878 domain-containing protein n=1 Tax=Variovorax saccharolyticus TaxID=3053516 RepID=UPI0025758D7A|nr:MULTISPECIES: DUF2878 domain-containing protein [unclassified Variovorax]MDM0019414.1 DUF2878 domain-containing protein [Variovorax sp. J22R187]MDM0026288.1 DUF2878 domain-containing protein [Variovorax sp. J31P216]